MPIEKPFKPNDIVEVKDIDGTWRVRSIYKDHYGVAKQLEVAPLSANYMQIITVIADDARHVRPKLDTLAERIAARDAEAAASLTGMTLAGEDNAYRMKRDENLRRTFEPEPTFFWVPKITNNSPAHLEALERFRTEWRKVFESAFKPIPVSVRDSDFARLAETNRRILLETMGMKTGTEGAFALDDGAVLGVDIAKEGSGDKSVAVVMSKNRDGAMQVHEVKQLAPFTRVPLKPSDLAPVDEKFPLVDFATGIKLPLPQALIGRDDMFLANHRGGTVAGPLMPAIYVSLGGKPWQHVDPDLVRFHEQPMLNSNNTISYKRWATLIAPERTGRPGDNSLLIPQDEMAKHCERLRVLAAGRQAEFLKG